MTTETFKPMKWKAHFISKAQGHWYEMECRHCGWTIAVPKQEDAEVLADRRSQMGTHIEEHLPD